MKKSLKKKILEETKTRPNMLLSEEACRRRLFAAFLSTLISVCSSPENLRGRMATQFIVHDKADTVGVVVVEDVGPGQELTGWIMQTDETISLKALEPVPLGHKIALRDIKAGETVLKYGHDVGRAVADVGKGRHVHIHNLKTKRW
jgi:(2R)-sulfolactate sulfo-lyase subunit alpha